jgi:exosortase A
MAPGTEAVARRFPLRAIPASAPVLATGLVVIGVLMLYWQTAASIVAIWWRSQTFAHGFFIVPICLWLAWRRRDELAQTPVSPWWPGLVAVFLSGALWFVMWQANVLGVSQFALAFMIQASILTVLGLRVGRILAFPLAFLLFAVPAGEFLIPVLMDWTADFTVAAIRWSGVPVYREGNLITLPTGSWLVAEACSGIRYLIASVMVGTIYAALGYRSLPRRAAFLAASIVVPIVANWLRAYGIVMIGHLSNNRFAAGADHLIYGWLFFGAVMLLLFWVGSFWSEPPAPSPARRVTTGAGTLRTPARQTQLFVAAVAVIFAAGIWKPIEAAVERPASASVPVLAAISGQGDWVPSPGAIANFKPHYLGAASELQQTFRKDGRDVGLYVAFYRAQEKGRELVTSGNALALPWDLTWTQVATGSDTMNWVDQWVTVSRIELSGPDTELEIFRLYWVNGRVTASEYLAKGWIAWFKITGQGDDSALIVIYAPRPPRGKGTGDLLRAFAAANSPSIEQALAMAQRGPR